MKASSKNRVLAITILALAIFIGIYQSMKTESNLQKINSDPAFAVAEVTNWTINARSKGITITYAFVNGSSTYFGDAVYSPLSDIKDEPVNAHFPVIYSKADPGVSMLLITSGDYKKLDKEQPDSLKKYNLLFE